MSTKENYYEILGVTTAADTAEIKSAYRKLARKYHPDVCGNDSENVQKFKEITEAYETLIDTEKKKKYDILKGIYSKKEDKVNETSVKKEASKAYTKTKESEKQQQGFSNVFNDILDNFKQKPKQKMKKEQPKNGEDINCDVTLTMLEAINGCNKTVNILITEPCKACNGRKFINEMMCKACNGKGVEQNHKKITVKIPASVKHGSKIRIPNEGNKGINGGKNGDLYLNVQIEASDIYKYEGLNINYTLALLPHDAVLGVVKEIPTLDGKISMKIMPRTSNGQKYRLTNQGLKKGSKSGDMIVTIKIEIPKDLSKEEILLYEQLKTLSGKEANK